MTLLALFTASWPSMAMAQVADASAAAEGEESPAQLREEVIRLRAEVAAMRAEMRSLREEFTAASPAPTGPALAATGVAPAANVPASASAPVSVAAAIPAAADPNAIHMSWKGTPEFKADEDWSFKLRGRIQIDGGYLSAPASRFSGQADGRGFTTRVRRAYIGTQGTMPGGFTYRGEAEFAGNTVSWTDLYLAYDKGPFTITVGQHHPFTSMEQIQSDLFLSFNERAAFIGAFNLERRVGLSAGFKTGNIQLNAGVFTDDIGSLVNDGNKSVSFDGRAVWMPKIGPTQLHFGASAHYRELGRFQSLLGSRYRQRPYIATTDIRYIDTGILTVDNETHYGAEFALNRKRFHLAAEAAWMIVDRPVDADPTFFGGYAEAGLFLTNDTRSYRGTVFDRITPTSPLGDGGFGALELNLRFDHLDLTDGGIGGGTQDGFGAGLIWTPVAYVRFMLNYMHLIYDIPSAQPKFTTDSVGMRAQVDF
ncbi:OprO/OprP family phosphate-selective porin [Croceibacterium xixiisoli]|uniref:OprO/OprP family phosphate-selective porin n=1 Tax=Croceibacterium xixiisoli TaxID=1476466 RepID=UPI001EFF496C|nr:porin [Croceibacterium xixiisoli]